MSALISADRHLVFWRPINQFLISTAHSEDRTSRSVISCCLYLD